MKTKLFVFHVVTEEISFDVFAPADRYVELIRETGGLVFLLPEE